MPLTVYTSWLGSRVGSPAAVVVATGWLVTVADWATTFAFGGVLALLAGGSALVLRPPE